jgi:predicted nucleic acid-binding OB-fold protein
LHRAGRSCRGDSTSGICTSLLVKKKDKKFARFLLENLKKRNISIPHELKQVTGKKSKMHKMLKKRNQEELKERDDLGIFLNILIL